MSTFFNRHRVLVIATVFVAIVIISVSAGTQLFNLKMTTNNQTSHPLSTYNTNSSSVWASLRGVDYYWTTVVGSNEIRTPGPAPSASFSQIRANGWNLLRVNLYWYIYMINPSQYISDAQTIAWYAEQNGLYVMWDLNHQAHASSQYISDGSPGFGFPTSITAPYPNESAFWTAWWANQTTYNGQNGWSLDLQYDLQIAKAVDNYSSTLGYEIMNEPAIFSSTGTRSGFYNFQGMQQFNNYIGKGLRTVTSKIIFFDHPYTNPDNLPNCIPSCLLESYPSLVSNIAFDDHEYNTYNATLWAQYASFAEKIGAPVVIGEWAPCSGSPNTISSCAASRAAVDQFIQTYLTAFKNYGWAWCYYRWHQGNTSEPWESLLNSTGGQWWLDSDIVNIQTQVYNHS
jgi:hypothetical protein